MNITPLTQIELNNLKNELSTLRSYLSTIDSGKVTDYSYFEKQFLNLINNQVLNKKTDLSNFLKTISQPSNIISGELYNFFSNYKKQNNHYVQSKLLKNILKSNNSLVYFNYSTFYKNFKNIASNNPESNECNILKDLRNNYPIGIKNYYKYFLNNLHKTLNPIYLINQPQTYFINNYTESVLKTHQIEINFINGVTNNSLSSFNIIRYFSLHHSRASHVFLSAIKAIYVILKKTNPISFNDYCLIQFFYHLTMIKIYCNELEYFINNISNLNFFVRNTPSIIFSDTIANTIKNSGYTGICINGSEILSIENKNSIFNNQNYLFNNFFSAQEFVCLSNSQIPIFYEPTFEKYFKNSFYHSIFPVGAQYKATNSIQKPFKPYLNQGYFLDNFKSISKQFEI